MKRVIVYDANDKSPLPDLPDSWRLGARLYRAVGIFHDAYGARSWGDAVDWLKGQGRVDDVQFWGHGSPGAAFIGGDRLDPKALEGIDVRGLLWLRTCSSFQGARGHRFAEDLSAALGCAVAGHTYLIGLWHSGLHCLDPHSEPAWSEREGIDKAGRTRWSGPLQPRTVFCLTDTIPSGLR